MSARAVRASTRSQTYQQHQQLSLMPQPKSKLSQKKAVKRVAAAQIHPSTGAKVNKIWQPQAKDKTPSESKITAAGPSNKQPTAVIPDNQQAAPSYRNNVPDLLRFAASPLVKVKTFKLNGPCWRMCLFDGNIYSPLWYKNYIDVHSLDGDLLNSIHLPEEVGTPFSLHPLPPQHFLLASNSGLYLLNNMGQVHKKIQDECNDVYADSHSIVTVTNTIKRIPAGTDSRGKKKRDKKVFYYNMSVRDSSPPYTERASLLNQPGEVSSILSHGDLIYVGESLKDNVMSHRLQRRDGLFKPGTRYVIKRLFDPRVCCSDSSGNVLVISHHHLLVLPPDGTWQQINVAELKANVGLTDALVVGDQLYLSDWNNKEILVYKRK